jgi:hypothetical protein
MDMTFVEGIAAVVSSVIVFCGSVWLLLSMVLGPRLAYFVTASVTFGFLLIMGVVWSLSPLGPVGDVPEWKPLAIGVEGGQLDAGPAEGYPDGSGWEEVDTNDEGQVTQAAELGSRSTEFLEEAIDDATSETGFADAGDATANSDTIRFLEEGDTLYGGVTLEPIEGAEGEPTVAILEYDPGNPTGPAKMITLGTLLLFALHLFGLSWSERRARSRADTHGTPAATTPSTTTPTEATTT